jgi:hypothetical protein
MKLKSAYTYNQTGPQCNFISGRFGCFDPFLGVKVRQRVVETNHLDRTNQRVVYNTRASITLGLVHLSSVGDPTSVTDEVEEESSAINTLLSRKDCFFREGRSNRLQENEDGLHGRNTIERDEVVGLSLGTDILSTGREDAFETVNEFMMLMREERSAIQQRQEQ